MKHITFTLVIILVSFGTIYGEGLLVPDLPDYPYNSLQTTNIQSRITIFDQVVTVQLDQTFEDTIITGEFDGNFFYPLPELASVTGLGIWIDDEVNYFELEEGEQGEPHGSGVHDPELWDFLGDNPFFVYITELPDPPFTLRLEYSFLLDYSFDHYNFRYPLGMGGFLEAPVNLVNIDIQMRSQRAIQDAVFTNYNLTSNFQSPDSLSFSLDDEDITPADDLLLDISLAENENGVWMMPYREDPDSSGYFLALLEPEAVDPDMIFQKCFTFVIDASRSMLNENRIEDAVDACVLCLQDLNPSDLFNVISFNYYVEAWQENPVEANEENIGSAIDFVQNLTMLNGTDLNSGMLRALSQEMNEETANQILLLSDGRPEAVPGAELNLPNILANIRDNNQFHASVYTVAVGDPGGNVASNLDFMRMISYENQGQSIFIPPYTEDIPELISAFVTSFSLPAMIDIEVDFGNIAPVEVIPPGPYSTFVGTQSLITGQYQLPGVFNISLNGRVVGENVTLDYGPFTYPIQSTEYNFVPRMWAIQKINYLLGYMSVYGENEDMIQTIIELSLRYGILTDYTRFNTDPPEDPNPVETCSISASSAISEQGVLLTWTVSPDPYGLTYNIYRKSIGDQSSVLLNGTPLTELSYLDKAVIGGQRYTYTIHALQDGQVISSVQLDVKVASASNLKSVTIFPNPSNEVTTVRFVVPATGIVRMELFDITGRLVRVLEKNVLDIGTYNRQISSSNLSSGIYLLRYRLYNDQGVSVIDQTSKLTILK